MLLGGVQGLFLASLLLALRRNNFVANRYLATILVALGLTLLHQFLVDTGYILRVPVLLGSTMPLDLLYPPTLYLYVRTMTQSNAAGQRTALHYLPASIGIWLLMPFFALDFDTKPAIVYSNYMVSEWPGVMKITYPIAMGLGGLQFTVYLALSFKLLFAHTRNISHFFSYRENITLSWLRNLLLLMVVFWLFMASFYYIYYAEMPEPEKQAAQLFTWVFGFSVMAVFYMGTKSLLQRRIYHPNAFTSEIKPLANTDERKIAPGTVAKPKTNKYKHSALTSEMSARILRRLTETMEQEKAYLSNNLTLPDLAEKISTSPNYLSQVINEQLQMNFFDYVNSYRVETAKQLLIKPLPHTHTILDIAMESAFNSKSAFYNAFKKQMGITPAEFKKSHS